MGSTFTVYRGAEIIARIPQSSTGLIRACETADRLVETSEIFPVTAMVCRTRQSYPAWSPVLYMADRVSDTDILHTFGIEPNLLWSERRMLAQRDIIKRMMEEKHDESESV